MQKKREREREREKKKEKRVGLASSPAVAACIVSSGMVGNHVSNLEDYVSRARATSSLAWLAWGAVERE